MDTKTILRNIFIDSLGLEETDFLEPTTTNNDLSIDSLDRLGIVQQMEDTFHIQVSDQEIENLRQFSDYVECVDKHLAA